MKGRALLTGGVAACISGAAFAQQAANPFQGVYVNAGAGADFLLDQTLKPYKGFGPLERTFSFDAGPAAAAGVGYAFSNGFRVEVQGDFLNGHVSGVRTSFPAFAGGYEQQYGGFLNGLYDFHLNLPVVPYVGAGIGAQAVELNRFTSGPIGFHEGYTGNNPGTHGNFAYQGIAGFAYPIAAVPGLALTADYRFIGVLNPPGYLFSDGEGNGHYDGKLYRGALSNIYTNEVLIGLRYTFGLRAEPAVAQSSTSQSDMMPPPVPAASRTYLVFFDWDRADLSARARQIVAQAAQASLHVQSTQIEVNGYTDLSGTAAYNERLSRRRAEAVQMELVRDGVPEDIITMHGRGESNPLVPTARGVREPQNRRVEILLQ